MSASSCAVVKELPEFLHIHMPLRTDRPICERQVPQIKSQRQPPHLLGSGYNSCGRLGLSQRESDRKLCGAPSFERLLPSSPPPRHRPQRAEAPRPIAIREVPHLYWELASVLEVHQCTCCVPPICRFVPHRLFLHSGTAGQSLAFKIRGRCRHAWLGPQAVSQRATSFSSHLRASLPGLRGFGTRGEHMARISSQLNFDTPRVGRNTPRMTELSKRSLHSTCHALRYHQRNQTTMGIGCCYDGLA